MIKKRVDLYLHHLKEKVFKTCPKSGRITGIKRDKTLLIFPLVGLIALVWFLIRVIPKPSRVEYPCQKIAAPLGLGFLTYLAGITGLSLFFKKFRGLSFKRKAIPTLAALLLCTGALFITLNSNPADVMAYDPPDPPNTPMGTARGIFPGRVVWSYDAAAAHWDGTGTWWSDTATDQNAVNAMFSRSIKALTNKASETEAWNTLFIYFNSTKKSESRGYLPGERIVIKVNSNNAYDGQGDNDNQIDASPQAVIALLSSLINYGKVPQAMITVYDASKPIHDYVYNPAHALFPDVKWSDLTGENGRQPIEWVPNILGYSVENNCLPDLPKVVLEADYIINQALLKGHSLSGITATAKNHYGSILGRDHNYISPSKNEYGSYNPLVDLVGHKHLGGKTLLFMVDGLYGAILYNQTMTASNISWNDVFGGKPSSSLFMSQDPIAVDSVCYDFINAEFPTTHYLARGDRYLHEGAMANDPESGVFYAPNGDGVRLESLGTHEHWNNFVDKQYSRNLNPGLGKGIELIRAEEYPLSTPPPDPNQSFKGDANIDGVVNIVDALSIARHYVGLENLDDNITNCDVNCSGTVDVVDALLVARYYTGLISVWPCM